MKALSCTFAALAILLSDVMCATVAFNYCDMLWGIRYASYSAPASTAFLLVIPTPPPSRSAPRSRSSFGEKAQNAERTTVWRAIRWFLLYFLTNRMPSVFGPQWHETVQPACVSSTVSNDPYCAASSFAAATTFASAAA